MGEGPPIRGSSTKPPPPPARAPIAPAPAKTDVVPAQRDPELDVGWAGGEEVSEITKNLEAPDATQLVHKMLELVASEAEALLTAEDPDGRLADLNVRTAFASWDGLHEPDEALRYLELAESHPLAPRLRLSAALAAHSPEALAQAQGRIESLPASQTTTALLIEVTEAWLFRYGRADVAAALVERVLEAEIPAPWREHVTNLAALAKAATGRQWDRVVEIRRAAAERSASLHDIAASAALVLDRGRDALGALQLCWGAIERLEGTDADVRDTQPSAAVNRAGQLRLIDVGIDAAMRAGDERVLELLDRRAELVANLPGGALEALMTRHAVAAALSRDGQHPEASALWAQLADDPVASAPATARRVALLAGAWAAAAAGDAKAALAARRRLVDSECPEAAAAHAWRALELAAAVGESPQVLSDLAHAVVDAADTPVAEWWLDLLDHPAPTQGTVARLEAREGLALRWAAELAEKLGNIPKALELWRRACALDGRLGTEYDHLVRLLRAMDEDELAEAYSLWALAETDMRCASALQAARGIVDLVRGDFVEAEETLQRAADLDPKDSFCRAALAAVYRAGKRYDMLAQVLAELSTSLTSRDARASAAREYAELLDEHLGDPMAARQALERMIAERPDDDDAMLTLAKLYDRDQQWARSIELRRKAVELSTTPDERAVRWIDIAVREERRGDRDAAIAALDKAAQTGVRKIEVMREQARVHRQAGRFDKALEIVRSELAGEPGLARRMQLRTEEAQLLTALDSEPEAVVAAYLDVLSIEPDQTEALAGIEAPARKLELWDELARAFRGAPQTPRNLEVLAEALAKIAEWSELAEVRRKQLEAAGSTDEKARRAAELARLYEHELGDNDAAIRMLVVAQASLPDAQRQKDLLRLLRAAERWGELAQALERELPQIRPSDVLRQADVLLELGALRADKLNRLPEAAQAFESVLERDPKNSTAAERLEKLYEQLGRDRELARMLELRAEATQDLVARAALMARVATLRTNRGDVDGAIAAYISAFSADPTNRDVFTAMERVCYKAERWAAAMQMYEIAIQHVETGQGRAYRLGDLYSRRGNVQLSFLGQVDAAIASYQKVVEVDSQPQAAVKVLEDLSKQRGDWKPLIEAYEKRAETQRDPQRKADALRAAAALATDRMDDVRNSVRLNRKLLTVDPNDAGAVSTLEKYFEETQDKSGLIDILKTRLAHSQTHGGAESVEIMKRIARVSEEGARDVDTATEHYQKVLEVQPENRDALDALGRIYESTEQWADFIDVTRRLIKITNDRNTKALLYFKCGSVMEAKFGREHDAIRYYDAAIKTSPNCMPAVHGLRDLYRRREEWPRVIETLELEVKLWSDDKERAGVFAQIGRIYAQQLNDPDRAMQYYDSALAVDPDCLPANQALFEHYFERGEWDKAMPIATSLAQKAMRDGDPGTRSEFYRKRGVVARMAGDLKSAADSFVVALEIKPLNTAALDDLGSLARDQPDAWDFDATYKELEKVYKKRDDAGPLFARVNVARAAIVERDGDLDAAGELYHAALELAPTDLTVLNALVDFYADMRRWKQAVDAIQKFVEAGASGTERLLALMRQANIHADGEMDPTRAIAVLKHVIQIEPTHQDAYYLLAQQCFLVGRYQEARTFIERVIDLATAPGMPLSAEALARYYYYKGRILDAAGDARAAAPQYRRAIEYDPGYAPPALVLARRAADGGDQRQAETLLIEAAHAAMAQGGPRAAVPLQRGLARILLSSGDRPAAIEAYRGILNVEPDGASDRVALAEIYAVDDPTRAIGELRKVLERDIHHAPAYRLLASFYTRTGDNERATRVLTALDLLGFAEETDRQTVQRLRQSRQSQPLRRTLDENNRERLMANTAPREPLGEVWTAFAEEITALVAQPSLGENVLPAEQVDARLLQLAGEIGQLFEVEPEIFVGDKVPGLLAVTAFPRQIVVVDRSLLEEKDLPLRFMFGYAFEAIRGGYAALLQLGARQRRELGQLMRTLISDVEPTGAAGELVRTATVRAAKVLERHAGTRDLDPGSWIDNMLACAKRAGLVACDDFGAAIWMISRLTGELLESNDDTVALGSVLGGPDLVRFYLSDNYQMIRDLLALPA
ncbi:MAG TPA: tetratricopeptide repeat protein [Kofleriaceae bacterium]|nr:tetratricopeptide repeat protein [Kofleriaceae bacterium]